MAATELGIILHGATGRICLTQNLENRSMHIAAGPPCENAFNYYPLMAGSASRAAE
ncbi:MAG: hypothetical protein VYE18_10020 [Pseudomonadota bacterium]|nr:hypothetical protein [Pseudomonadota bacterium]